MATVSNLPSHERPREKLYAHGPEFLSDCELIAIVLGRGCKGFPVLRVARTLLKQIDEDGDEVDWQRFLKVPGIGRAKAAQISAAMEFARRRIRPAGFKVRVPTDALPLIRHYADRKQEHFICISLNGANEVNATRVVTVGLVNQSQVHPREVFADPITDRAAGIIVAHNHPSGTIEPSLADVAVTRRLKEAGSVLGIPLLDHIIFTHHLHYSFALEGRL